jgi:hypothetical protein
MQEKLMLNTLQFNMSVPTAYVFMRRFLKAAQADKKVSTVLVLQSNIFYLFGFKFELEKHEFQF